MIDVRNFCYSVKYMIIVLSHCDNMIKMKDDFFSFKEKYVIIVLVITCESGNTIILRVCFYDIFLR